MAIDQRRGYCCVHRWGARAGCADASSSLWAASAEVKLRWFSVPAGGDHGGCAVNAVKFGRDLVKVDLGWAVVELAVVGGAFEAVVVSAVSFDHPGVCSVSSRGVGSVGDFVGGFGECGGECFRGKSPPGW